MACQRALSDYESTDSKPAIKRNYCTVRVEAEVMASVIITADDYCDECFAERRGNARAFGGRRARTESGGRRRRRAAAVRRARRAIAGERPGSARRDALKLRAKIEGNPQGCRGRSDTRGSGGTIEWGEENGKRERREADAHERIYEKRRTVVSSYSRVE